MYTLTDIYKDYKEVTDSKVEKKIFREICEEFNINIIEYLLDGKVLNLGNNLSTLSIVRMDRDPRNPAIDWGESNKYKEELLAEGTELFDSITGKGQKWHIYFTDDFYCKFYWRKGKCKVPNKSVYRFDATRGLKGNKERLIRLLKEDDLAYLKFRKNGNI